MDFLIKNGQNLIVDNQIVMVRGQEELLQRVRIACLMKKDGFALLPDIGVDFSNIDLTQSISDKLKKEIEMRMNEAVHNIAKTKIKLLNVYELLGENADFYFAVYYEDKFIGEEWMNIGKLR